MSHWNSGGVSDWVRYHFLDVGWFFHDGHLVAKLFFNHSGVGHHRTTLMSRWYGMAQASLVIAALLLEAGQTRCFYHVSLLLLLLRQLLLLWLMLRLRLRLWLEDGQLLLCGSHCCLVLVTGLSYLV